MVSMKLAVLSVLAIWLSQAEVAATVVRRSSAFASISSSRSSSASSHRTGATPDDIALCLHFLSEANLLNTSVTKELAVERVVDHCARSKTYDDENYICVHVEPALKSALRDTQEGKLLTKNDFCMIAENYMLGLRGATSLPDIGDGPLMDFKVSERCAERFRNAAIEYGESLPIKAEKVPSVWYMLCANTGCKGGLPSRNRGCVDQAQKPTHAIHVCQDLLEFANEKADRQPLYEPEAACSFYAEFVAELGDRVEAYELLLHKDLSGDIPSPSNRERALRSSRLVNNAESHFLRDNAAAKPAFTKSSATIAAPAFMAASLAALLVHSS